MPSRGALSFISCLADEKGMKRMRQGYFNGVKSSCLIPLYYAKALSTTAGSLYDNKTRITEACIVLYAITISLKSHAKYTHQNEAKRPLRESVVIALCLVSVDF